jgi:hypothetical protein
MRSQFRTPPGRPARHGKSMLTRVLNTVNLDTIDHRSKVGYALRRIREDLVAQLGGPEEITPALQILVDQIAIKCVITQSVGNWLLNRETLVDLQHQELVGVVMQHDILQRSLATLLDKIGLQRRTATVDIAALCAAVDPHKDDVPTRACGRRDAQLSGGHAEPSLGNAAEDP